MMDNRQPKVFIQGKAIVERVNESGLLVMLPNGEIREARSGDEVLKVVRDFASRHPDSDAVNVLTIEWRGVTPPRKEERP